MAAVSEPIEPRWMVVANVKRETEHGTGGAEKQVGLKHFSPGTKVYFVFQMHDRATVLGRHRGGSRLVKLVMQLRHLENFRAKLVYETRVLKEADGGGCAGEGDAKARLEQAILGSRWGE